MIKHLGIALAMAAIIGCGNSDGDKPANPDAPAPTADMPENIGYQIINTYPRDSANFTQGLEYAGNNRLLESAGQYGESDLRYTDIATGKVLKKTPLTKEFFGEGTTRLHGKIYQLTYRESKVFVYDSANLKPLGGFVYNFGEGWGITNDGTHLIISNGGSNLFYYHPENFKEVKRIGVTNAYGPVGNLNELEYIAGNIYANVWGSDVILRISPESGKVTGVINLEDLRARVGVPPVNNADPRAPEVLNGIAFDSAGGRLFVTGKYWPKLVELKLDKH